MSYAKRYVAVCDLLGFSEFVEQTPLPEVVDSFRLFQLTSASAARQVLHIIPRGGTLQIQREQFPHVIFSDTVLLWVEAVNPDHGPRVLGFIDALGELIASTLANGFLLRVGLAYGECYIDPPSSTYLGKPIIDAYRTEQSQNWIGGACHASCLTAPWFQTAVKARFVYPYQVPVKPGATELTHAIEWVGLADLATVQHQLNQQLQRGPQSSIRTKIENTIRYFEDLLRFHSELEDSQRRT